MKPRTKTRSLSRHIVVDPAICHGKPTFLGTRVLVADVLDQIASGMDWYSIIDEWNGSISKQAISEAVQLANQAMARQADASLLEPILS
jgi:uncharacterized protein (DUF433 family)